MPEPIARRTLPHEGICTRCLIPSTVWYWARDRRRTIRCQPCHRRVLGDSEVDRLILDDVTRYSCLWDDRLMTLAATTGV